MSFVVDNAVRRGSRSKNGARTILMCLASYADEAGVSWPSVESLARDANMTRRNVQLVLRTLVQLGELTIREGQGPRGCNLYQINLAVLKGEKFSGAKSFQGEKTRTKGAKKSSPPERAGGEDFSPDPSCDPPVNDPPPPDTADAAGGGGLSHSKESLEYLRKTVGVKSPKQRHQLAAAFSAETLRCHWEDWQRTNPQGRVGAFVLELASLPPGTPPPEPPATAPTGAPPPAAEPPPSWLVGLIPDWEGWPEQARRWLGSARYDPDQRRIVGATEQVTILLHQRYSYLLKPFYDHLGGPL